MVDALGLPHTKVVPWDWTRVPIVKEAKVGAANTSRPTACFAGMLTEDKGVGDCIDALLVLHAEGIKLSMSFAGLGELAKWQARAESLGLVEQVRFLGH